MSFYLIYYSTVALPLEPMLINNALHTMGYSMPSPKTSKSHTSISL